MLKLLLLPLVLLLFPAGRRTATAVLQGISAVWRPTIGLLAVAMLTAAAVLTIREDWWLAAGLAAAAAAFALAARKRGTVERPAAEGAMSPRQARSILGVADDAGPEAVEAAFRRLMQRTHPDKGGTTGLAAQLNAARAALRRP